MKKRIFAALCVCALLLGLTGCSWPLSLFGVREPTTASPATQTPASSTTLPSNAAATSSPAATAAPVTDENGSAVPVTEPPTTDPNAPHEIGVTKKGYRIVEHRGLIYINGVLIVNKTYGVPADYDPGALTPECDTAFRQLQSAAAEVGLNIFELSGYRSYETQQRLYQSYCERDGQELADTFSARPGYSEHQTGLAIDVNSLSRSFGETPEGRWLDANAHRYGFIIRYRQEKQALTGYAYEPWHIRYVGLAMAQALHESGMCLEEYFGIPSFYLD